MGISFQDENVIGLVKLIRNGNVFQSLLNSKSNLDQ